jgi:glycosyltransferase involved in cell wall biosynthesis
MHILFLTENFPPEHNAPASHVYERACYWIRWGHRVTVVTSVPNFPEGKVHEGYRNRWYQTEDMDGIHVVRVKTFISTNEGVALRTLDFLSFMIAALVAGLFQARPDVVVATSPQFFTAVGGWALCAIRGLPFIFELRDLWPASILAVGAMGPNIALRLLERLELFLYRRASGVVALTSSFKSDLVRRGVPPHKVEVVVNGVDLSRYAPRSRDVALGRELGLDTCFVVGYVGTHGMAHALERVLEAADLLRDTPGIRFLFVGAGAARASLIEESRRRLLDNVIFVPSQPKERMPAYWSLCDLALIHLKNTPVFAAVIPSKMFEAMGMGRAILMAAPEGEATRIVREIGAGVVVAPENPAMLADTVRTLAQDRASVERFAHNALSAAPLFSREKQARAMIEVLERVVADLRRPVEAGVPG